RGAASAGAAAKAAAEEARNDRRLKRLMAHAVSSVARSTTERARCTSEILSQRRHACGIATAMPYSRSAPTELEPREGDDDDRRARKRARSDFPPAVSGGAFQTRRARARPDRAHRRSPPSVAGLARNRRCELGRDRIRHQCTRAALDLH